MIASGTWVQIERTILGPDNRAEGLPDDTKHTPYNVKIKGFLQSDAEIGQKVAIRTKIGRLLHGVLVQANPRYTHDFGDPVPELLPLGAEARSCMRAFLARGRVGE